MPSREDVVAAGTEFPGVEVGASYMNVQTDPPEGLIFHSAGPIDEAGASSTSGNRATTSTASPRAA